jgi:hypothetical protein
MTKRKSKLKAMAEAGTLGGGDIGEDAGREAGCGPEGRGDAASEESGGSWCDRGREPRSGWEACAEQARGGGSSFVTMIEEAIDLRDR